MFPPPCEPPPTPSLSRSNRELGWVAEGWEICQDHPIKSSHLTKASGPSVTPLVLDPTLLLVLEVELGMPPPTVFVLKTSGSCWGVEGKATEFIEGAAAQSWGGGKGGTISTASSEEME